MSALSHLATAVDLFRAQKVRFLLTVSGIVVGVGSLVVMASLLEVGSDVLEQTSAEASGDDVLTVSNDWQALQNHPEAQRLAHADQDAIARSTLVGAGATITADYGLESRNATWQGKDFSPMTIGVDPQAFEVHKLHVARGRAFSTDDYASGRRVAIAGADVQDGKVKPGDAVRVEGTPYTIVGVLEEKPEMGPGGPWSWNNRLLFPSRTYNLDFNPSRRPTNIVLELTKPPAFEGLLKDYVLATRGVVDAILLRDRSVKSWEYQGVEDDSSTGAIIVDTIQALLYLTTVFSMIVGGINIMNIMLVTVTERTREIGLRRAVGASRGDILRQFLAETLMVTLLGAAIGVTGALAILAIGSWALTKWVTAWPFEIEPWSLGLSLAFSGAIGLVFGLYPAWRASRLDPVEALRSD